MIHECYPCEDQSLTKVGTIPFVKDSCIPVGKICVVYFLCLVRKTVKLMN